VSRPVIGISAAAEPAAELLALAVQDAGGLALLLPPDDAVAEQPAELLDMLDALLLAEGPDIDPGAYGATAADRTRDTSPERDRFELALAYAALERDMPLLGARRGMQMLNVACGGTLDQDVQDHSGGEHTVLLEPGSLAARAAGAERVEVGSEHHQGLAELGEGVVASGRAADGLVEAVELHGRGFALGVLWQPGPSVIGAFVAASQARG
jgi:putative glutamine amidotransferase